MTAPERPHIYVLAGVNGAGKSSIGGAAFRANGADYYNPDETARALRAANPALSQADANAAAWQQGKRLLEKAIAGRLDFAFETTLGANTIPALLAKAAAQGIEVHVWYAGLASPELHIERVRRRVRRGGHDIAALRVYDNSADADPAAGKAPAPRLVLHMEHGKILGPADLSRTPGWAKPIVAAALKLSQG